MLSNFMRSSALAARTKCMYGRRLTRAQYEFLSSRHNVAELVLYMKTETNYRETFSGVNENMLHYGQIEALIKRDVYKEYMRLCALAFGHDKKLISFFLLRVEMAEILGFIMMLLSGKQKDYVCGLPDRLRKRTKVDFGSLYQCADYQGFLESIRKTRYYPVLADFAAQASPNYTDIEVAVTLDYYDRLEKIAKSVPDGHTREAIRRRLRDQAEMINISRIMRMKKYYGYSAGDMEKNLVRFGKTAFSPLIRSLIGAETDNLDAVLDQSKYGVLAANIADRSPERLYHTFIYRHGARVMYGSMPTAELALSYFDLKQIEIRNIITIVEGIRLGFPPPKTLEYLVM